MLDQSSKDIIKNGYIIFDIEDQALLENLKIEFLQYLKKNSISVDDLSKLHEYIEIKDLNQLRLGFFNEVNKNEDFNARYLKLGFNNLTNLVGTELASNKNVNFSLQLPGDTSSKLSIHSDTFSGESEYQINLWVPLTNSYETNSMFIFNPKFSKSVTDNLSEYEELGIEMLLEKNKEDYVFLNVPYGKGLIFTPTCLHGNIRNDTDSTRVSFNCRYKNLFSPCNEESGNEKKLGIFYTPLSPKAATLIGMNNSLKK